jgi:hypothetical protein
MAQVLMPDPDYDLLIVTRVSDRVPNMAAGWYRR